MKTPEPIFIVELFPEIDRRLIDLLRTLSPADWEKPTIAPLWKVKDVVAHLLDGSMRMLSMDRDGYFGVQPENVHSYADLVAYLNQLNGDWVHLMKRVSPRVLTDLLELVCRQEFEYLRTLPPYGKALFSVGWAGEEESPNWFHLARQYTEKWHHQQQIRLAVGREAELLSAQLYFPYLDTSMRALPYHYRAVPGAAGDLIRFSVTGEGGGDWWLHHNGQRWELVVEALEAPTTEVIIPGAIAWRMLTKGISRGEAEKQVKISGNQALGEPVLHMLAVMA